MLASLPRADEQRPGFQLAGVGHLAREGSGLLQGVGHVQPGNFWPALADTEVQRFIGTADRQVAAPFVFAFVALLLAGKLLQRRQFGLPRRCGKQPGIGGGAMPVRCFGIAGKLVEAVDTVAPALQHRGEKLQARVVDDLASHAALSCYRCDRVQLKVMAM
ncbi:hypothetical protein D3C75_799180 [compost metagenome]